GKAYVRKSTATPPGSARSLDQPPPITTQQAEPGRKSDTAAKAVAHEASKPAPSRTIKVDDGRDDDAFSKSMAEDELGMSAGGRKVLLAIAGVVVVAVCAVIAVKRAQKSSHHEVAASGEQASAESPPAPAVAPVISPMNDTPGPTPAVGPAPAAKAAPAETMVVGARKTASPPVAAAGARDDAEERASDPRLARERMSEARPLLYVCRMAFEQKRMKDAESACVAA